MKSTIQRLNSLIFITLQVNLEGMKFVVTGGAGFIGSHLVEELIRRGNKVIVVDNFHTGNLNNLRNLEVEVIRGRSKEIFKVGQVDGVFHLGIPSSSPMYKENRKLIFEAIEDFVYIMEFVKKHKLKLVFASSSSIYNGNPIPWREDMRIIPTDFYTEARYAMERIAEVYHKLYGTQTIILRLFSVYGTKEEYKGKYANLVTQFLLAMLKNKQPTIFGDGTQTRDFIFVKDVVRAFLLAMNSDIEFGTFNVGTGKNYSLNQLIEILNKILGKTIKAKYVKNPIKNYVWHTLADITKAKEVLGFEAKIDLKEGIKKIKPYYEKIVDKL